jgi:hypothetical protein
LFPSNSLDVVTESDKYDMEVVVRFRDVEIKDLSDKVSNCRGKL